MINIYTFNIITLGCRVNQYESRSIAEKLVSLGFEEKQRPDGCDLCIINTCAVTAEASRKSRQMIRRAAANGSDPVVIAVGCWTQIEPEKAAELGCADLVCGVGDKQKICETALDLLKNRSKKTLTELSPVDVYDRYDHTKPESIREFLKIEDGCDGKCAYCVIPKARGPVRSRDPEEAFEEARTLCKNGAKELVVTGIEISGYQLGLTDLLKRIDGIEELERIRLGSLDPFMMNEEFVSGLASIPKIAPHFHLSIQSGCSRTLAAMRRRYNAGRAMEAVERIRKHFPRAMLTCDLIVGFPGETDEDHTETMRFMEKARFLHAHIFPYSPRPGTEAAGMPGQLSGHVKEKRLHEVEDLQKAVSFDLLNEVINKREPLPVLIEKHEKGYVFGHSDNFIEVKAKSDEDLTGRTVFALPSSAEGEGLCGKIV